MRARLLLGGIVLLSLPGALAEAQKTVYELAGTLTSNEPRPFRDGLPWSAGSVAATIPNALRL